MPDRLTPAQVRAARGILDWSMLDLARAARLSVCAIHRFESGDEQPASKDIVALMQDALETEGVLFVPGDGNGPGVRFWRR